jgi:hypothetical protein
MNLYHGATFVVLARRQKLEKVAPIGIDHIHFMSCLFYVAERSLSGLSSQAS